MSSRRSMVWRNAAQATSRTVFALLLAGVCLAALGQADPSARTPSRAQVQGLIDDLRRDPDLQTTQKIPFLHWKKVEAAQAKPLDQAWITALMRWLANASRWVATVFRWGVWLLGAVLVALLIVGIRYWIREHAEPFRRQGELPPDQVGSLDVRPESLPDDIGAEARSLWMRGEFRGALSLLYRGALSRLIHEFAVPIRASHTEPECQRLASQTLAEDAGAYFARLVRIWERAVYGARQAEPSTFLGLCDEFDRYLARQSRRASAS